MDFMKIATLWDNEQHDTVWLENLGNRTITADDLNYTETTGALYTANRSVGQLTVTLLQDAGLARINIEGTSVNDAITITSSASVAATLDGKVILDGGAGNDILRVEGLDTRDTLYGGEGNDRLYAGSGNDRLEGGMGNDMLYGEDGDDRLYGQHGDDMIFGGTGDDVAYGHEGDDHLSGQDGRDYLYGMEGNDRLVGGNDKDYLFGGDGQDILLGGNGSDRLDGGAGMDTIQGNNGNDRLYGREGDDVLYGSRDNDYIYGGDGDDILIGGEGRDRLYGQEGSDTFVFESINDGLDRIHDFTLEGEGQDFINITGILSGYSPVNSDINDFVDLDFISTGRSDLLINADGQDDDWVRLVTIRGSSFENTDVDDLLAAGQLITSSFFT